MEKIAGYTDEMYEKLSAMREDTLEKLAGRAAEIARHIAMPAASAGIGAAAAGEGNRGKGALLGAMGGLGGMFAGTAAGMTPAIARVLRRSSAKAKEKRVKLTPTKGEKLLHMTDDARYEVLDKEFKALPSAYRHLVTAGTYGGTAAGAYGGGRLGKRRKKGKEKE